MNAHSQRTLLLTSLLLSCFLGCGEAKKNEAAPEKTVDTKSLSAEVEKQKNAALKGSEKVQAAKQSMEEAKDALNAALEVKKAAEGDEAKAAAQAAYDEAKVRYDAALQGLKDARTQ